MFSREPSTLQTLWKLICHTDVHLPGLGTFWKASGLGLEETSEVVCSIPPDFTDKETEASRGHLTAPRTLLESKNLSVGCPQI